MATVYVRRLITNAQMLDRAVPVISSWARMVQENYVRPKTPKDTGELRTSLEYRVTITPAQNVSIVWYARAPHAEYLEDVKKHGAHIASIKNFTTPGTEAPFLRPNIERAYPTMKRAVTEWLQTLGRARAAVTFP